MISPSAQAGIIKSLDYYSLMGDVCSEVLSCIDVVNVRRNDCSLMFKQRVFGMGRSNCNS